MRSSRLKKCDGKWIRPRSWSPPWPRLEHLLLLRLSRSASGAPVRNPSRLRYGSAVMAGAPELLCYATATPAPPRGRSPRHHRHPPRDSAARSSSPHRPAPGPHQGCLRRRPGCLRIATRSIFLTATIHFQSYAGYGPFRPRPRAVRSALDHERSVPPLCLNRHQAAWCLASCIRTSPLHHRLAAAATAAPPPAARCLRPCYARLFCARRPGRFAVLFLPCAHAAADKPPRCQTATMSALAPAAEPPGRG